MKLAVCRLPTADIINYTHDERLSFKLRTLELRALCLHVPGPLNYTSGKGISCIIVTVLKIKFRYKFKTAKLL